MKKYEQAMSCKHRPQRIALRQANESGWMDLLASRQAFIEIVTGAVRPEVAASIKARPLEFLTSFYPHLFPNYKRSSEHEQQNMD